MSPLTEAFDSAALSSRWGSDGVYFELYKLASEQKRLGKLRLNLERRMRSIDDRLAEIALAMQRLQSHPCLAKQNRTEV
ncbi:hypothetical protein Tph_c10570 [Thermacetogenium phaeum DSM 12270]|uniref:Uncharacterized protein n=1 Tax=Thermacetogenium phaeum (strain ATCC BAA-254 / DSM 26808 / PB) TaxID=1089553 RepID=K4LTC9_THEPS|nr:hypothetical protein [Thermacetogenium phaeum]AFV11279.1 hypothetical protein Tph_c10570 [Thermacetogenium phaeum DSM 12270]